MAIRKIGHVVLYVTDISRSVHFYQEVLGLPMVYRVAGRTGFQTGETLVLLHPMVSEDQRPNGGGIEIYLQVDNVDEMIQAAIQHRAQITQPPTNQPWGERDAGISDPDGYRIFLSQSSPRSFLNHLPCIT